MNRGQREKRFGGNISDFLVIYNCFGSLGESRERTVTQGSPAGNESFRMSLIPLVVTWK